MSTPGRSHSATSRRLPPFGRELATRLADRPTWSRWKGTSADGNHLTIWVYCGADAWVLARARNADRLMLIVPPGEDPANYDWRLLRGHDPIVLRSCGQTDGAVIKAVILALMRDGVKRVIHGGRNGITRYRREGA